MWSSPRIRSRDRTGPPGPRRGKSVIVLLAAASLSLGGAAAVVTADHNSQPANAAPAVAAGAVSEKAFINRVAPWAKESQTKFGVPASVSIAQAILESSWGGSTLTSEYNAYFGIKCSNTSPYAKGCVDMNTWEVINGGNTTVKAGFRTYASPRDSFMDHGNFLKVNSRYAKAFNYPKDANQFIREVHKAGYATDPSYSTKVINLMGRYNLYSFDGAASSKPTTKPTTAPPTKAPTKAPTTKPTATSSATTGKSATPSTTARPSSTATPSTSATPSTTAKPSGTASPRATASPRVTATQTSTPSKTATPSATAKVTAIRAQDPNVLPLPKQAPVKKATEKPTMKAATAGKPGLPSTGA